MVHAPAPQPRMASPLPWQASSACVGLPLSKRGVPPFHRIQWLATLVLLRLRFHLLTSLCRRLHCHTQMRERALPSYSFLFLFPSSVILRWSRACPSPVDYTCWASVAPTLRGHSLFPAPIQFPLWMNSVYKYSIIQPGGSFWWVLENTWDSCVSFFSFLFTSGCVLLFV